MAMKSAILNIRNVRGFAYNFLRKYNTKGPLVNLEINEKTGIATATLQRPPVNSLSLELISELSNGLTDLEKNKCRGLILTSGLTTTFCAGLDITEMCKPDLDRLKQFWTTMQQVWIKLYGTSFPTVAVVNGHAPAGGCLLALSCEYRVMLKNFKIGLNETQLGVAVPKWISASMQNAIGSRQTEIAVTSGRLFTTEEALHIGLIDEIATNREEAIGKADNFFQRFAKISPLARSVTKKSLRGPVIQDLVVSQQQDLDSFISNVMQEQFQKEIHIYLETLKQRKK